MKIGKRETIHVSWKRILYTVCFFFVCVIDQRVKTCAPNGGGREIFRDLSGICMAGLILSHYSWKNVVEHKIPYLIWSVVAIAGLPFLFVAGMSWLPFLGDWVVVVFEIFIWGYVVIATFINAFLEKNRPKFHKKTVLIWLLMMFLMIISRSEQVWPFCYLVMFGCFYLTDYCKDERDDLLQGALNGIILSFFIFQGLCFLYRPYDAVRYVGWYTNCNNNALYYVIVLAAVLTKLYGVKQKQSSKWLQGYYYLGVGTVLSFLFMTIGRASWITAIILTFFTLFFLYNHNGKKTWLRNGCIIIVCMCLTFPLCFAAARYIPPLRHHPIWFEEEWNPYKVHSWDPWDSEKYIDIDELLDAALGRVVETIMELIDHMVPALKASAAEANQPLFGENDTYDGFTVRTSIYKHFWDELNWRGHTRDEIGLQLTSAYWVGHAHNIFLQFGTDFGIPVMVLFAVLLVWSLVNCFRQCLVRKNTVVMGSFLWLQIPLLFGMFEYAWGAGSLVLFMLFFSWRDVFWSEEWKDTDARTGIPAGEC